MPEATIERDKYGRQVITCDWVKLVDNELYWYETWEPTYGGANNLDRLYAVLKKREELNNARSKD